MHVSNIDVMKFKSTEMRLDSSDVMFTLSFMKMHHFVKKLLEGYIHTDMIHDTHMQSSGSEICIT
jgi:2-hydroxy-3-keto-5-methylthiopentenyl-1-phosphate phosphatase